MTFVYSRHDLQQLALLICQIILLILKCECRFISYLCYIMKLSRIALMLVWAAGDGIIIIKKKQQGRVNKNVVMKILNVIFISDTALRRTFSLALRRAGKGAGSRRTSDTYRKQNQFSRLCPSTTSRSPVRLSPPACPTTFL